MTIGTKDEQRVLRRLVDFAGDPAIVEDALEALRVELATPPTLEQLLSKILELREERGLGRPDLQAVAAG